jgi:hypothetical protein
MIRALLAVGGALTAGLAIYHIVARRDVAFLIHMAYGVLLVVLVAGAVSACVTMARRTKHSSQTFSSGHRLNTTHRQRGLKGIDPQPWQASDQASGR